MGKYNFLIFRDFFRRPMIKAKISNYIVRLIKYIKVKSMKIIRKGRERSARPPCSAPPRWCKLLDLLLGQSEDKMFKGVI